MKKLILLLVLLISIPFESSSQSEMSLFFNQYKDSACCFEESVSGIKTVLDDGYVLKYDAYMLSGMTITEVINECKSFLEFMGLSIYEPDRNESNIDLDTDPSMSNICLLMISSGGRVRLSWWVKDGESYFSAFLLMDMSGVEFSVSEHI